MQRLAEALPSFASSLAHSLFVLIWGMRGLCSHVTANTTTCPLITKHRARMNKNVLKAKEDI